jgi:hypothetical protein
MADKWTQTFSILNAYVHIDKLGRSIHVNRVSRVSPANTLKNEK